MPINTWNVRGHLKELGIDHSALTHADALTMSYSLHGWQMLPATRADAPPIIARVWLLAALNTRGRYQAPERFGHPAELEDGGAPIDSVILMAVIQRHFLAERALDWDDPSLAEQLGLPVWEIARAQRVLDAVASLPLRARREPPLGRHWWRSR
jgi:hypothetical protein